MADSDVATVPNRRDALDRLAVADDEYAAATAAWRDALAADRSATRRLTVAMARVERARDDVDLALTIVRQAEAAPLVQPC